jgi:hypothetical protein
LKRRFAHGFETAGRNMSGGGRGVREIYIGNEYQGPDTDRWQIELSGKSPKKTTAKVTVYNVYAYERTNEGITIRHYNLAGKKVTETFPEWMCNKLAVVSAMSMKSKYYVREARL